MCFGEDFADSASGDGVAIESGDGGVFRFGRDSDQQAAGGLRVEEQIAVFLWDACGKTNAITNEIAVIFQAAGEKSSAGRFDSAGKIRNYRMLDLQGNRSEHTSELQSHSDLVCRLLLEKKKKEKTKKTTAPCN